MRGAGSLIVRRRLQANCFRLQAVTLESLRPLATPLCKAGDRACFRIRSRARKRRGAGRAQREHQGQEAEDAAVRHMGSSLHDRASSSQSPAILSAGEVLRLGNEGKCRPQIPLKTGLTIHSQMVMILFVPVVQIRFSRPSPIRDVEQCLRTWAAGSAMNHESFQNLSTQRRKEYTCKSNSPASSLTIKPRH